MIQGNMQPFFKMTLDEHKQLGAELKIMRDRLVEIRDQILKACPWMNEAVIEAKEAHYSVDHMRVALEKFMLRDYGHHYPEGDKTLFGIYFPEGIEEDFDKVHFDELYWPGESEEDPYYYDFDDADCPLSRMNHEASNKSNIK